MPVRTKHQSGCIVKDTKRRCWFGRWYEDRIQPDGSVERKLVTRKLADISDRYQRKRDVQPLLDDILRPLNAGQVDARSTMTLTRFVEDHYLPHVEAEKKPSTHEGYRKLWEQRLKPVIGNKVLRELKPFDVYSLLLELSRDGLGRRSVHRAKWLLSAILAWAVTTGALPPGGNFVPDVETPATPKPKPTHAATENEVLDALDALKGKPKARAAIALMFYAGLRPGEARGVCWEDFTPEYNQERSEQEGREVWEWQLKVRRTVWRNTVGTPKTESSEGVVLVVEPLLSILRELREAEGSPSSGFILRGALGRPLNLDVMARKVIKPAFQAKNLKWHGYYAYRRGLASLIKAATKDSLAAMGALRHSDVSTTEAYYIKAVSENTPAAIQAVEQRTLALMAKRAKQAENQSCSKYSASQAAAENPPSSDSRLNFSRAKG